MTLDKPAAQPRRPRGTGNRPIRGVRVTDKDWGLALHRAHDHDKITRAVAIAHLAGAYAAHAIDLPTEPRLIVETSSKSVRLADTEWLGLSKRAEAEGFAPSAALSRLIVGYARGTLNLPRITYKRETN